MEIMFYIGLNVHKRKISYYVKGSGAAIHAEVRCHAWKTAVEDSLFSRTVSKGGGGKSLQIACRETPLLPPDTPPRKRKNREIATKSNGINKRDIEKNPPGPRACSIAL
jgi:hypothetical protein